MNKLSFNELKKITKVISSNNVDDEFIFNYFRIVALNNEKELLKSSDTLYFITYATEIEAKDGWYINEIDLRKHIDKIMKENNNYTFVIDKTVSKKINNNYKYIVVEDLNNTINDLFKYFKNKSHAKTIAITGSVGKTTCVGIIESVLREKYNVWRIYSKRITPLLLKTSIINYINDSIDFIVLENSIYYHDHVKILADLMKPEITAILNIESSHLGIELLKTIDDICKYKALIMSHAKKCFIIKNDSYLDNLHLDSGKLYYKDELILSNKNLDLEKIELAKITVNDTSFKIEDITINPFILSSLAQRQYNIAYHIGKYLGLSNKEIETGFNNFSQVENRVNKETAFGKEIIFDGDITTYERIKELSDNLYKEKYLVLRKVGSAENTLRIADIKDFFHKYKNVYIFDDVEYLEELKNMPNVIIVNNHDFIKKLNGIIIYHYSGYFRVWDKYDENNLHIYDTVKYPIIKEGKMKKKILLLHGWNWRNYTKLTKANDAWNNRLKFVQALESKFEVYKLNFPGFCGEPEPKNAWNLNDYAKYVKDYLDANNLKVDYILGYSFGGAVAIKYSDLYDRKQRLILISPAITRNADKSKKMIKTPAFMQKIRKILRDFYLIHIVKNPYMKNGTSFLNESYQIIVRVELLDTLKDMDPNMINIIYGSDDDQVNPKYVYNNVSEKLKKKITIIDGGGHDIANTHINEIMKVINEIE